MIDRQRQVNALKSIIRDCVLCPRKCRVNRLTGQIGECQTGADAIVASVAAHFGEEPVLVGAGGSGTIFLGGCNLACLFCQNYETSRFACGTPARPDKIAAFALRLQERGCENINFVSPTHVAHAVAEAVLIARTGGLALPIVYNCGGYESVETLELLEGLVDIYMPDFKWADAAAGLKYSGVPDYPAVAREALAEMYRQAGPLELDTDGTALRGVLVRHLVMPGDLAHSKDVIETVAKTAPGCAINVMGQYRPAFRAPQITELLNRPEAAEVASLRVMAASKGLIRVEN